MRRLPDPVQEIIKIAACVGNTVPLGLLASVPGLSQTDASRSLWTAVRAGLLVPLDPSEQAETNASFRFAHDRIRQAAYLLLEDEARKGIHVRIGRQLLRACSDEHALDEQIYAIVDQLDRGMELVTQPQERLQLSQLNLRAAHKARGASAYGPALDYLKCAIALLPEDAWESHRHDTFALHREAVQFAGLAGELQLADELFARTLARAESPVEKADLYNIRMYSSIAQTAREDALEWGIKGVRLFGIELPFADPQGAAAREMRAIALNMQGRKPADLLDAPRMRAPEDLACMDLLATLTDATYFHRPELFPFVTARLVNMSLERGNATASPQAFIAYAVMLAGMTQDYQLAHAFGRLSLDLGARFGDPIREMKVAAVFTSCVNNWIAPLHTTLPLDQTWQVRALQTGDTYFAAAFSLTDIIVRMHQGTELARLVTQLQAAIALHRTARNQRGVEDHLVFLQAIRALQGLSAQREDANLAGTALDEQGLPIGLGEASGKLPEYQIVRLGVACLLRDFARAFEISRAVAQELNRVPRFVQHVEYNFYSSITLAARCNRASAEEKPELLAAIAANQQQLGLWARNSPENYGHKHLIVAAELARLEGQPLEAADFFDRAISAAAREQFLHDGALANELCGRFYLAQGRRRIAVLYLSAAIDAYARWGAKAKVDALEAEFAEVTVSADRIRAQGERGPTHDKTGGAALDLLALFRAAEAVSSEVVLARMLGKLMEVCLATAGRRAGRLRGGRRRSSCSCARWPRLASRPRCRRHRSMPRLTLQAAWFGTCVEPGRHWSSATPRSTRISRRIRTSLCARFVRCWRCRSCARPS